jgi:DNA/RNA endonuclease G (NUC1)
MALNQEQTRIATDLRRLYYVHHREHTPMTLESIYDLYRSNGPKNRRWFDDPSLTEIYTVTLQDMRERAQVKIA